MKTKFLSILLVLVVSLFALSSCNAVKGKEYNATGTEYFEFTLTGDGNYALSVKEGVTLPAKLKLPAEYNGKAVIEIASGAFKNNTVITEVIIPVGYEIVGYEAFAYCTKLSMISIGQYGGTTTRSTTTIRSSAFQGCSVLANVTLGECVKVIDSYAFYETMITGLTSCRGLEKIGYCSFGKCSDLKSFYVPASLTDIDPDAFKDSKDVVFNVADSNPVYKDVDGKIVNK